MIILCVDGEIGEGVDNDPDPIALHARQRELDVPHRRRAVNVQ